MYWNENYPIGIADIPPKCLLECDSSGQCGNLKINPLAMNLDHRMAKNLNHQFVDKFILDKLARITRWFVLDHARCSYKVLNIIKIIIIFKKQNWKSASCVAENIFLGYLSCETTSTMASLNLFACFFFATLLSCWCTSILAHA